MKNDRSRADGHASAVHLLHRAGQCADELFSINIGKTDLTPRQFTVLSAVATADDLSQTDLVEQTGIDRSTLADIVRRLVERGFVARKRTKRDARMYAVRATTAGRTALATAMPASKATDEHILSILPAAQRAVLLDALARIIETMGPISSARVAGRAQARTGGAAGSRHRATEAVE